MKACHQETEDIIDVLGKIATFKLKDFFPNLKKVTVGAIYGRETNVWSRYEEWHISKDTYSNTGNAGTLFARVLASGNIAHLCVRDPSGPYNIPTITFASACRDPNVNYSQTIHFDYTADHDQLACPLGSPITWLSDTSSSTDLGILFKELYSESQGLIEARSSYHTERRRDTTDITIYCSSSNCTPRFVYHHCGADIDLGPAVAGYGPEALRTQVLTKEEERQTCQSMGAALQTKFRQRSGLKDVVRWLPQSAAPRCEACGSLSPA